MKQNKPLASLSLDLDNKWSYLKTHGDPQWESFPSYLDIVVPRALEFLARRKLSITFFIVGQDAAIDSNRDVLSAIPAAGHEIGNHSFHHEPWLHLYSAGQIEQEIALAEEHITKATGHRPVGFRGPGFSLSPDTLRVLSARGYLYDASTFPTFIGPLARAYYFMTSKLNTEELRKRSALFGTLRDGLRPNRAYRWQMPAAELLEIPVTTVPFLKAPFHVSYIMYLSTFSRKLAINYFRSALRICRWSGVAPSVLLHPLDFLGREDVSDLSFFPAMGLSSGVKFEILDEILEDFSRSFSVTTLRRYASEAAQVQDLHTVQCQIPGEAWTART